MLTEIKLVDGTQEMILRPRDDIAHASLDVGFPSVREVVTDRTDDDGTDDTTSRLGSAAVSLTLKLYTAGTTRDLLDEFKGFCHPSKRPYLYVTDDEWPQVRRIQLRADQATSPIEAGRGPVRDVQASFKAPLGLWEDVDETPLTIAADLPSTSGFTFPVVFPLAMESTLSSGAAETVNVGNVAAHWTARLYGPCTAPVLVNEYTGEQLVFTDALELGVGEYVEVNTRDRTVYLLSDTDQSRLGYVDFDTSSWWLLQPGLQRIRYAPTDPTAATQAVLSFRPRWL